VLAPPPADPAAADPAAADRSVGRAIAFLALAAFAAQSMVRVTDSLLPQIAGDLGVTVGAASIVVTAYALTHGSVQLIIGPVGDRFGKYLCVTLATAASTLLVLFCGLAQSLPTLVAARLACGLSAGWIIPLAMAYIGDVIPYDRRQQVLGRFLSGQITGQLFGQAAGGVLGDLFGWRRVFFFLTALFAIATVALLIEWLRNPLTHASSAPAQRSHGFVAGYSAVFRSRWARFVIFAAFLESGLMFGIYAFVGADLHVRFDLSFSMIGLIVGMFAIGGLVYSLSVTHLVARLGQTGLLVAGGILLMLAYWLLALTPVWWLTPVATIAIGLGFYMLHNTLQTNATQMTPQARGTAVAVFSSALYLGQTLAVAIAAFAFDRYGGAPIFLTAGLLLLGLGVWFQRALIAHRQESAI